MNKRKFWFLLAVTYVFLLLNEPYAFNWIIPSLGFSVTAVVFLVFLFFFIGSLRRTVKVALPSSVTLPLLFTGFIWSFYAIFHSDTSYLTRIFILLITYFFLLILYRSGDIYRFWVINNRFILLQSILSSICLVLVGIGLLKPLMVVSPILGSNSEFYFWGLCFSKTYIGNLIRPSGFFDEPGALASWAIYGLMFNYAFIKDRVVDKYIPYFTASTLSVAYFIQLGMYLIMKNVKRIYKLVPIGALLFLAIGFVNTTKGTDFDLYEKTIARFEYSDEGVIAGNSRLSGIDNSKKMFKQNPIFGMGGQKFAKSQNDVSDNPYEILAKDGLIGMLISYLPLVMVLFVNRRREVVIALLVVAAGYLQRPLHINFVHDLYIWSFLLFAIIDAKKRQGTA